LGATRHDSPVSCKFVCRFIGRFARPPVSASSAPASSAPFDFRPQHRDKLAAALHDSRFRFRSIGALSKAIGMPEAYTVALLQELGARQEQSNPQLWGAVDVVGAGHNPPAAQPQELAARAGNPPAVDRDHYKKRRWPPRYTIRASGSARLPRLPNQSDNRKAIRSNCSAIWERGKSRIGRIYGARSMLSELAIAGATTARGHTLTLGTNPNRQ
jgi:hypothetical protein